MRFLQSEPRSAYVETGIYIAAVSCSQRCKSSSAPSTRVTLKLYVNVVDFVDVGTLFVDLVDCFVRHPV